MARKERNEVDYFPHSVNHGKKMFYLRATFGNDGYAVWFMLLEHLGKASRHYLDLSDEVELMYLSSEFKVSETVLKEIIKSLVKFGEFDKDLWEENTILFNEKFIDNISDAYKKRNNDCINKNSLLALLVSKGIRKPSKSNPKQSKSKPIVPDNTQSIVKDTKVDESKEYYIIEDYLKNEKVVSAIKLNHKLTDETFLKYFNDFKCNYLGHQLSEEKFIEVQRHFNNWIKKEKTSVKKENKDFDKDYKSWMNQKK